MRRTVSIRWRLTLWYGGLFALSLAIFSAVIFGAFARDLVSGVDRALDEELVEIISDVETAKDAANMMARLQKNFGSHEFYEIQVATPDGRQVFSTPGICNLPFPVPTEVGGQTVRETVPPSGSPVPPFRVSSRRVLGPTGPLVVQAADPLKLYRQNLRGLLGILLGMVPAILAVAVGGGYFLARRALAPVDALTTAAAEITSERLDRRVEVAHPDDELGRLARTFNEMIAGLQKSFEEMRRFTADAAHELRTPLAVLKTEAEIALRMPRSTEAYRQALQSQLLEIDRLTRLADQLLFLCREDANLRPPTAPVRLDLLLSELSDQLQLVADARGVSLEFREVPACTVASDSNRLRRLFFNLLDNALKYTPASGDVSLAGRLVEDGVEIVIEDTGVGIAAEHLPHLFERFYRVDPARSRATEGTGLGLAICRSIVEAHRGRIGINSQPGRGARVTVVLPCVDVQVAKSADTQQMAAVSVNG